MISVCIATYNGSQYIRRQLESIIAQLSDGDEIIISDDGSSDTTLEIIRELSCPLIKIYQNQGEHGYTPNFENALRHAKGHYIFLSDQDDVWREDRVFVCMQYLKKYDLVISDASIIDGDENELLDSFYGVRKPYKTFLGNILKFGYLGCCMAFKRDVLIKSLPFPKNHVYCAHDNWITLIGMGYFKTKVIDEKLVHYRRHGANASAGFVNMHASTWFRISYRMYLLWHVIMRVFR